MKASEVRRLLHAVKLPLVHAALQTADGLGCGGAHKLRDRAVRTRRGVSGNRPGPIANRPAGN